MKTTTTDNLVIGLGQIGSAIQKVLGCDGIDVDDSLPGAFKIIHICIPHSEEFIDIVEEYQREYKPEITVIHSTVPVGTCRKLGAVHSPVRGVHPDLEGGIRTFVKYFGGNDAEEASKPFVEAGVRCEINDKVENIEALKLWSTTQYGVMIMLEKTIWDYCQKHRLDFATVYTKANLSYNEGYKELGMDNVIRPVLKHVDGEIGGHCVNENSKILNYDLQGIRDSLR